MVGGPKNVPNVKNSNLQSILPGEKDQKHENRSFSMISRIPQLFILFAPENRFFVEVRISTGGGTDDVFDFSDPAIKNVEYVVFFDIFKFSVMTQCGQTGRCCAAGTAGVVA